MNRVARVLLDTAFLALILAVLAIVGLTRLPAALGLRGPLVIQTASMQPDLPPGSLVFLRPGLPATAGATITFQQPGKAKPTTHAVIAIRKTFDGASIEYQTQGTANPEPDPEPVPPSAVLGVVTWTIPAPALGWSIYVLSQPVGMALAVSVGLLLILARSWLPGTRPPTPDPTRRIHSWMLRHRVQ